MAGLTVLFICRTLWCCTSASRTDSQSLSIISNFLLLLYIYNPVSLPGPGPALSLHDIKQYSNSEKWNQCVQCPHGGAGDSIGSRSGARDSLWHYNWNNWINFKYQICFFSKGKLLLALSISRDYFLFMSQTFSYFVFMETGRREVSLRWNSSEILTLFIWNSCKPIPLLNMSLISCPMNLNPVLTQDCAQYM